MSYRCICAELSRQVLGVLSNNMILFDIVNLSELISQIDILQSRTLALFQILLDMAFGDSAFFAALYHLCDVLYEFVITRLTPYNKIMSTSKAFGAREEN